MKKCYKSNKKETSLSKFNVNGLDLSKMYDCDKNGGPLGGIYFVEKLLQDERLRIEKRIAEQESIFAYQRNNCKDKKNFGYKSSKALVYRDQIGDFKITQSNPWTYVTKNSIQKATKSANSYTLKEKNMPDQLNNQEPTPQQINRTRSLSQLEEQIQQLIRTRFHSVNKYFSLVDSTHTETINKERFVNLMEKLDFPITEQEANLLWIDFKEETIKFSNFLRRFFLPKEFDKIRHLREKIDLDIKIRADEKEKDDESKQLNESLVKYRSATSFNEIKPKKRDDELKEILLSKILPQIIKNWKQIKQEFLDIDTESNAFVTNSKAIEILKKYSQLSKQELESLCLFFDLEHKSSKFDYINFLANFKTENPDNSLSSLPKWTNVHPLLQRIIKKLRDVYKEKKYQVPPLQKDFINLRYAFKRFDNEMKGFLTSKQFQELLKFTRVEADHEDTYQMQAEFDTCLNGNFDYPILMKQLIGKSF